MNNESDQHRPMVKYRIVTERLNSFDTGYDVVVFSKQIFLDYFPQHMLLLQLYDYHFSSVVIMLLPLQKLCICHNITAFSDKHKHFKCQMFG